MNPEKCTNTSAWRTGRHPLWNAEICKPRPDARSVHAEHSEIARLDLIYIILVRNRQGAAFKVIEAIRVVFRCWATWTYIIGVRWLAYVSAFGGGKKRSCTLITSDFKGSR